MLTSDCPRRTGRLLSATLLDLTLVRYYHKPPTSTNLLMKCLCIQVLSNYNIKPIQTMKQNLYHEIEELLCQRNTKDVM
jgi:hypothetical protein